MGLFDLPAPLFGAVDSVLATFLPAGIRLVLWGILAGWLTMLLYRRWSRQEAISELKQEQRAAQDQIARFEGEFNELWPMVRTSLSLGFRQLGLSIGPALLATIPIIFIVVWVAGSYSHSTPAAGQSIEVTAEPNADELKWRPQGTASRVDSGWEMTWPGVGESAMMRVAGEDAVEIGGEELVAVIHKRKWWNILIANPAGYLPADGQTEIIQFALPEQSFIPFGPGWMRGWMFLFFLTFLLSSIGFKLWMRIN